jgi:hypothetical protein
MRLPAHVVAELAQLLDRPDPADLVSPTGARRAHVRTHAGDPHRRLELLLGLSLALVRQLAYPPELEVAP